METKVLVKNRRSQAAFGDKDQVYKIRARVGRKQEKVHHTTTKSRLNRINRINSHSPRRNKSNLATIFKDARQVRSSQTYLENETQNKLRKGGQPTSPRVISSRQLKYMDSISCSNQNRSISSNANPDFVVFPRRQKNIYKTIQITIDGHHFDIKNKRQLLTTLSRIILNEQTSKDHYSLQILDESAIMGEEQNFIEMDSIMFTESVLRSKQEELFS